MRNCIGGPHKWLYVVLCANCRDLGKINLIETRAEYIAFFHWLRFRDSFVSKGTIMQIRSQNMLLKRAPFWSYNDHSYKCFFCFSMTTSHCRNLVIWLEVSVRNSFLSCDSRSFRLHPYFQNPQDSFFLWSKPEYYWFSFKKATKTNKKVRIAKLTQTFHAFRSKSGEFVNRKWLSGSFLIVFKTFNFPYNELHENSCFSMLESVLCSRSCLFCSNHQLWNS